MNPSNVLNSKIETLKSKVEGVAKEAISWGADEMDKVEALGENSLHEAETLTTVALKDAASLYSMMADKIVGFVRRNPILTVAVIASVGFVVAKLVRGSRAHVIQA